MHNVVVVLEWGFALSVSVVAGFLLGVHASGVDRDKREIELNDRISSARFLAMSRGQELDREREISATLRRQNAGLRALVDDIHGPVSEPVSGPIGLLSDPEGVA